MGSAGQRPSSAVLDVSQVMEGVEMSLAHPVAIERPCQASTPEQLKLDGITHLNFAFMFFHPTTFEITPMTSTTAELIPRVIALKKRHPGMEVWAAIGGWSFNDETNSPNTRTAFSDMVSTTANRAKFISALLRFIKTYGFDGVDLDWEYPGAEDRGGKVEDTANLVLLLKEMRAAFQGQYGLSATLPASFWYLRWFDVNKMQNYLDWFNVMTYDIHGVWDASSKFSGPFVRPHTNLTEIGQGLDLLWRAGVEPAKVILGLGWYGRSFTLEDGSCSKPGCRFTQGGAPGRCTRNSGTLSNAEIVEIINEHNLTPVYDKKAGVNWITWNNDQWVSYDDDITFAQKINYANSLCLGGTMIWAIDLDDLNGTTNSHTIGTGLGKFNIHFTGGVFFDGGDDSWSEDTIAEVRKSAYISDSCYTSFCGESCAEGYTAFTYMRGQVDGIKFNTSCADRDTVQSLCCVSGGNPGRCEWRGWRGQGLSCSGGCRDELDPILAVNTNHVLEVEELGIKEDQTCNGGYQKYCCRGYMPPENVRAKDVALIDANSVVNTYSNLNKRDNQSAAAKCASVTAIILAGGAVLGVITGGIGAVAVAGISYAVCITSQASVPGAIVKGGYSGALRPRPGNNKVQKTPATRKKGSGHKTKVNSQGQRLFGTHALVTYASTDKDCSVTYTCSYGVGYDEVCDNQRWGIDKILGGNRVYHYAASRVDMRRQEKWRNDHNIKYKEWPTDQSDRKYCEVDEFPMGSLFESGGNVPQALRAIDGDANGLQGNEFQFFVSATWVPCSSLLMSPPPITWEFLGPFPGDNRLVASGFIGKYGFNSMVPEHRCFAKWEDNGVTRTIRDHGFRVDTGDPMFSAPYHWTSQNYKRDPGSLDPADIPVDVNSAAHLRRRAKQLTATCAETDSPENIMAKWWYDNYGPGSSVSGSPPPAPTDPAEGLDDASADSSVVRSTPSRKGHSISLPAATDQPTQEQVGNRHSHSHSRRHHKHRKGDF
ncbi:chitotriosidase-1 [Trichophyton mentagrophytes]|nr:chitotriosidase-1 [Trichophyton mentagrophytes]